MKPRDLGDMYSIAGICPDLSAPLRLWLRSGRDDCGLLIDSFLDLAGMSKVSQDKPELSGTMKIRKNAGEKSRKNKLEGFIQA